MNNISWSFTKIWNDSLEQGRPERKFEPRLHIWATELGGSFIDRYLKMQATPYTNPPNPRSKRKFEAGNMMEWLVKLVLKRAGILIPLPPLANGKESNWLEFQYPTLLRVTGKLDALAGGKPDWEKAKIEVTALELPEFFDRATDSIIQHFSEKYPDGLKEIILEVKSVGSYMYDSYEKFGTGNPNHKLQLFHYLKARNMREGHVVYICKDDLRMLELGVFNPSPVEDIYKTDIEVMTKYILTKEMPPLEKQIVFSDESMRFSANWKVAYSNYLKKLYGYEDQFSFDNTWKPKMAQWNRVLGRCVKGESMTKMNIDVVEEIKKDFPNFDEIVKKVKKAGVDLEKVTDTEELDTKVSETIV